MALAREHFKALTRKYYERERMDAGAMGLEPLIPTEPEELKKFLAAEKKALGGARSPIGDRTYGDLYNKMYPLDKPPPSKPPRKPGEWADLTQAFIEHQDPDGWSKAMEIIYPEKEEK
jgi:hypothetical protein